MKKTCFHYVWGLAISIGWTLNGCVSVASLNAELVKLETHGIHDELVYSSFLKSYEIVALSDSVPEALIKFPDRILFAEDRIFVVDRFGNKVLMFDREGNFLKSTASMTGKGHNVYIRLMDAAMDKEGRTLYVHCDAPYQIMVFNFDLNLKEVVQTDYYMDEVVADGRFIYGIRTLYRDETGFELVALERNRLQDTPRVLLSFTGGVPGRRTTGKSLMQAVDGAYVSFPFDTHVYKIRNAEVVETYNMDFGEEGLIENPIRNGVTPDWFDCNCADLNWSIVNMTVSDSVMLFNTNREYAFMVNTDRKSGGGYLNFHNDMLPFSFSRIIPTGGLPGTVVYRPFAETIAETLKQYREKDGTFPPELQEVERKFNPDGNPLLIVWKIK